MTEGGDLDVLRGSGLRRGPVEPLSPQAWQRVESAVFARLDAPGVPWSLAPAPRHSHIAPGPGRSPRLHWATSVGLALVSAAAAASVLHLLRTPPRVEAGPPAELMLRPPSHPVLPALEPAHRASEPAPRATPAAPSVSPAPAASLSGPPLLSALPSRPSIRPEPPDRTPPHSERERWFDRATSLETANAPLALALYRSLARGDDAWAANALYAAARLELDRGQRDAGAAHLTEYLARFPHGENAVDVRRLRQHIGTDPP